MLSLYPINVMKTNKDIVEESLINNLKDIGTKIRVLRQMYGMSIAQLAKYAGINARMLFEFEHAYRRPNLVHLTRIALVLNTDIQDICTPVPATKGVAVETDGVVS